MIRDNWKKIAVVGVMAATAVAAIWYFSAGEEEYVAEPAPEAPAVVEQTIGTSVEGRSIRAVTFGNGDTNLLFVGGVHGGYEWNSILLAYRLIDYFYMNPEMVPDNLSITIVPNLNPDGLYAVAGVAGRFAPGDIPTGTDTSVGRFNANDVDLNRNFDCKWSPESTWRGQTVSAGSAPFSEPEAVALRDLVLETEPQAVVFWHSQAGAVYGSECEEGILPETMKVMNIYATAATYPAVPSFDAYPVTGDAEGWLATLGIPAVTVEFTSHDSMEWEKNLAGVEALLERYSNS